jgi:hypothetical protein
VRPLFPCCLLNTFHHWFHHLVLGLLNVYIISIFISMLSWEFYRHCITWSCCGQLHVVQILTVSRNKSKKVTNIWKKTYLKALWVYYWPKRLRRRRTNEKANTLLKQRNIMRCIEAQRLSWLGHLERMHKERTTKKISE